MWSFSVSQADGILLNLGKTLEGPGVYPVIPNSSGCLRSARRNLSSMTSSHIPPLVWSQRPGRPQTQHGSFLCKCQDGVQFSRKEGFMRHPHPVCLVLLDSFFLKKVKCYLCALFYLLFVLLFNRASCSQNWTQICCIAKAALEFLVLLSTGITSLCSSAWQLNVSFFLSLCSATKLHPWPSFTFSFQSEYQ